MQMRQYDNMSDMRQIGLMINSFPVSQPESMRTFVDLLKTKQLSASEALQHQWIVQGLVTPQERVDLHTVYASVSICKHKPGTVHCT